MQSTSSEDFYARLPPIGSFDACLDDSAYTPVPGDWTVLISDVRRSTQAIADGRYKAVNMVGAATIAAILNAADGRDLPYAFGGDGGTVIVPPSVREPAVLALRRLRAHCGTMFELDLRVGAYSVADLAAAGHPLGVCKYELSPGNTLGFLNGTGHDHATGLLKSEAADGNLSPADETAGTSPPVLEGLSCRWHPLASQNGTVMTLVIAPRSTEAGAPAIAPGTITGAINAILDGDMNDAAPLAKARLRFAWPPDGLWLEAVAASSGNPWRAAAGVLASSFAQWIAEVLRIRVGDYDPKTYHGELRANTDYRKRDGKLYLVLDVTPAQAGAIEAYLTVQHEAGRLDFGIHRAREALMTCLVSSLSESRHIHFIDGADGGHTLAALDLKQRAAKGDSPAA